MPVYDTRPDHALFSQITGQSSDHRERLALLSEWSKTHEQPQTVQTVREWLWVSYQQHTTERAAVGYDPLCVRASTPIG